MANKWVILAIIGISSGCGGSSMRGADGQNLSVTAQSKPFVGKCATNDLGFEVELAYRNRETKETHFPDPKPKMDYLGEHRFKLVEPISLFELEKLNPSLDPVFVFPDRCFDSPIKQAQYRHIEIRESEQIEIVGTREFYSDRFREVQFSLLDVNSGERVNLSLAAVQRYQVEIQFENQQVLKIEIDAIIQPTLPQVTVQNLGWTDLSNDIKFWTDKSKNWFNPMVFDAQKITNPSDRPIRLWLSSFSSFKLWLNFLSKDPQTLLSGNGLFAHQGRLSIHRASVYAQDGVTCLNCSIQIGFANPHHAIDLAPQQSVIVKWEVMPSPGDWPWIEVQNAYWDSRGYYHDQNLSQLGGSLRGTDGRSVYISEVSENAYNPTVSKAVFSTCRGSCSGRLTQDELFYAGGESRLTDFKLRDGVILTGL